MRIISTSHAHLQIIIKTPVQFQKDRPKTVVRVTDKGTRYMYLYTLKVSEPEK